MQITVHGTPTNLKGKNVAVGAEAPAARVIKLDGSQNVIGMIAPKAQLLIAIPSLKTEVCSLGAKKFNDLVAKYPKLQTIMITTDEREFVAGYAKEEAIQNAELVVDEQRHFGKKYGLLIEEGKLKERLARAVFLVDTEGVVVYKELVGEIVDEVDYEKCIAAIEELFSQKKKGHTHENWMMA